jgi:hypothetical protein
MEQQPTELADAERKSKLAQQYDAMNQAEQEEFKSMFTDVFPQELEKEIKNHD